MSNTAYPEFPILIVDDERDVLDAYKRTLIHHGISNLMLCQDSLEVMNILSKQKISVLMLDLFMPNMTGEELLRKVKNEYPQIPIIVITGANKLETAVECMKAGAFDYMVKPVEISRLCSGVMRALEIRELQDEVNSLKRQVLRTELENPTAFDEIITNNDKMKSIFKYLEAIAASSKPILVTGESGVGKELFARAIHRVSQRTQNFITVNIAGLDDVMFSDTLFGHKKGAFTGAVNSREGLITKAGGGTLFLDEIGDLEFTSQVKLLRLLQENEYYPLGSDIALVTDARIIAATNCDLNSMQLDGKFRRDLYYRLITHHIHIPPLRERLDDIPFLVEYFMTEAVASLGRDMLEVPNGLYELLATYSLPGNIRELQSIIYDSVSRSKSNVMSLQSIEEYIKKHSKGTSPAPVQSHSDQGTFDSNSIITYTGNFPKLKDVEEFFINEAMEKANGTQAIAAHLLGISPSTLCRRVKDKKAK